MSILSLDFFLLTAVVWAGYYLLPLDMRWVALLAGSVYFVMAGGWQSALYLTAVAALMWSGAFLLERWKKKGILAGLLLADIGAMMFCKAGLFAVDGQMILPIGLSYYTFQSAGYLIDVYRGKAKSIRNPLKAWLFLGYFPQMTQGPISTWKELGGQLSSGRKLEPVRVVSGFQLLLWGCFKKMVIADRLTATTQALLKGEALPGWLILGGVMLYTVRLYMDFSGGMDVVRGVSRMLGVELPENFRRPFFAKSVAEYWRRWHITLGAWFRSYVLYPLVSSRAGVSIGRAASGLFGVRAGSTLPSALATAVVFLLIGLWHGFSWNAVIYGLYFGLLMGTSMMLEPFFKKIRKKMPKNGGMSALRMIRTGLLILPAQFFAFTPSTKQSAEWLTGVFQNWTFSDFSARMLEIMPTIEWGIAAAGCAVVLTVDVLCEKKIDVCQKLAETKFYIRWAVLLALLLATAVFGLYGAGYDGAAFLYTQF